MQHCQYIYTIHSMYSMYHVFGSLSHIMITFSFHCLCVFAQPRPLLPDLWDNLMLYLNFCCRDETHHPMLTIKYENMQTRIWYEARGSDRKGVAVFRAPRPGWAYRSDVPDKQICIRMYVRARKTSFHVLVKSKKRLATL